MINIRRVFLFLCIAGLSLGLLVFSSAAHGTILTKSHSSLNGILGFPSYSLGIPWFGGELGGAGGYIKIGGAVGGTLASTEEGGSGKLDLDQKKLWFQGNSGASLMDFGIQWWAKYKIVIFGFEYIGDLPWIGSADLRWADEKAFTPHLLGQSLTLSDSFDDQQIVKCPVVGIPGATVDVGASLTASASNKIEGIRLATNRGIFCSNGEKKNVSMSGSSFSVSNIVKWNRSTLTLGLTPNGTIGISVGPFSYPIHIPTIQFPINIPSLEFSSSPERSITFNTPSPNNPPDKPSIWVQGGSLNTSLTPTLETSAFSDPDGDTHESSWWGIWKEGAYIWNNNDIWDQQHLTQITVPSGVLSPNNTYTAHVRHRDNHLKQSDDYGLVTFTTAAPVSITVTSPNGGENWQVGSSHYITWSSSGNPGSYVKIDYSTNGGLSWSTITNSTSNDGSYNWTVPNAPTASAKVRVTSTSNIFYTDTSNSNVTISAAPNGSLKVTISPQAAINAGAQWQVDGGAWRNSGYTQSELSVGSHSLSFKEVTGWSKPDPQAVTVSANQTKTVTGTYIEIPPTGTLSITTTPVNGTISVNGVQKGTGSWSGTVNAGSYTVTFGTISGYTTPNPQTVTVTANQTKTVTGTYVEIPPTGSLKVTISPQAAINAGAQWQVDGGAWHTSEDTQSELSVGSHTLSFKALTGWSKPGNQTVTITSGQTTITSGIYTQQTGSLKVTISPQAAINAGVQWRVDGGAWHNSGYTQSGLSVGSHSLSFKEATGWTKSGNQTVTINSGQTTITSGTYPPPAGSLSLDMDLSTRNYDDTVLSKDIESTISVPENDEVWIAVVAQGVTNLDTYQVEVSFDTEKVEFIEGVEEDPSEGIENLLKKNGGTTVGFQAVENVAGTINIANALTYNDCDQAPEGTGIIALLKFRVLDTDPDNQLTLGNVFFIDCNGYQEEVTNLTNGTFTNTQNQIISIKPNVLNTTMGSSLKLTINYDVSDNDNTLSALAVRIHFDSTKLEYNTFEDLFETNKLADPQIQDDLNNEDNDDNTDKIIILSYSDPFNNNWPNEPLPLELVKLLFNVKDDAPEVSTNVNVSKITGHIGYGFIGNGSVIDIPRCNLDVDGNGAADGGTDGIMLIRYLFEIRGDALINEAVAPDCTRCTAEDIEAYLNGCGYMLDVDGNGVADGGTDGIMLIRYLFEIRGDVLINEAVAPDCTRCTAEDIEGFLLSFIP